MLHLAKRFSLTLSMATLVVVIVYGLAPSQVSFATPLPAAMSARIMALSGLAFDNISEMYVVEQGPKVGIIASDINIPIVVEPKVGYLLIKNATTGEWIRVTIDLAEWDVDFRPYFEENGIEILRQPYGSIAALTPAQEAVQLALVVTMSGTLVADLVENGAPHGTVSYTYDPLGRLETITHPDGKVVTYTYDAAGNRETLTITGSQ